MKHDNLKAVPHVKDYQGPATLYLVTLGAMLGVVVVLTTLVDGPSGTSQMIIINLVLLTPGVIFGVLLGRGYLRAKRLDQFGKITGGTIVERWIDEHSDEPDEHYVAYQFGDGVRVVQKVKDREFERLLLGTPVTVRYLPKDPAYSRIEL